MAIFPPLSSASSSAKFGKSPGSNAAFLPV
jgi:hypothetical protein